MGFRSQDFSKIPAGFFLLSVRTAYSFYLCCMLDMLVADFQPQTMEDLDAPFINEDLKQPKSDVRETVEVPGGKLFLNVKGNCIEGKFSCFQGFKEMFYIKSKRS